MKFWWSAMFGTILLLGIFGLQNFPADLNEVKTNIVISKIVLLSPKLYRLPQLLIGIACLWVLTYYTKSPIPTFLLAISPWFVQTSLFDPRIILSLLLLLLAFVIRNKLVKIILIILFVLATWPSGPLIDSSLSQLSLEVDQRVRTEVTVNNHQDVLPLWFKRLAYNKYYFGYLKLSKSILEIFDWDKLASPSQISAIVAKNLWADKGLPNIFFWYIPLAGLGLLNVRKLLFSQRILNLVALGFAVFTKNTFLFLIPLVLLAANGWKEIQKYAWKLIPIIILLGWGVAASFYHLLNYELYWRSNRPFVYTQLINLISKCPTDKLITVTEILGPTRLYYTWMYKTPKHIVSFRHFDLTHESVVPNTCYVGFPGEFLGNRGEKDHRNDFLSNELPSNLQLVASTLLHDSVSYGNGDFLWVVQSH